MIIRTSQHWLAYTIDTLLTFAAWIGFTYLLVNSFVELNVFNVAQAELEVYKGLDLTMRSLQVYLLLSLVSGLMLLGWAKYNQIRASRYDRRRRMTDVDIMGLAESYRVQPCVLKLLQMQQVMIAHNDQQGDLLAVELPALGLQVATRLALAVQGAPQLTIFLSDCLPATADGRVLDRPSEGVAAGL